MNKEILHSRINDTAIAFTSGNIAQHASNGIHLSPVIEQLLILGISLIAPLLKEWLVNKFTKNKNQRND